MELQLCLLQVASIVYLVMLETPYASGQCLNGFVTRDRGFCYYKQVGSLQTYWNARADCSNRNAVLTSVRDQQEQSFLEAFVRADNDYFWIGLKDYAAEGDYRWEDGTPFTFVNWASGQPDNSGNEDCVHFRPGSADGLRVLGTWNDLPCDNTQLVRGYICKADANECGDNTNNCHANAACTNSIGSFACSCNRGYTGNGVTCNDVDECSTNRDNCHRDATCTNTIGSFTCSCNDGYSGNGVTCYDVNECYSTNRDNCHRDATCTNTIGSFTCSCNEGYSGDGVTCYDIEPPSLKCPQIVDEHFVLTDERNVTVSWPEPTYTDNSGSVGSVTSTHTSPYDFGVGVHQVVHTAYDPSDNAANCTITVTVTAACPDLITVIHTTEVAWLQTPAKNQTVYEDMRCDVSTKNRGSNGTVSQVCMRHKERSAVWSDLTILGCGQYDEPDLSELSVTEVVYSNVLNVAKGLETVVQELVQLTPNDIEQIAEVLQNIAEVESDSSELTIVVLGLVDILVNLTDNDKVIEEEGVDTSSSYVQILQAIEQQVESTTGSDQVFNATNPNVAIVTINVDHPQNVSNGLVFAVVTGEEDSDTFLEGSVQIFDNSDAISADVTPRTSMSLPSDIFSTSKNASIGVSFVVYNSNILFPTNSSNQTVGSDVISAIVVNVDDVSNLTDPVIIQLTVSEIATNPECVFWDFHILDWSSQGCELEEHFNDTVICYCYHLTNFAVLVDATYTGTHFILDILSKIGCAVSLVALLLTLGVFIGFRQLRLHHNRISRLILIHLCLALFLLYVVFLFGIERVSHRNGCIFVAVTLQYLTLVSMGWMGVESFNVYLKLVKIFDAEPPNFVLKAACVAWGLPLIITVTSFAAGFSYYDHMNYCFVSTGPPLYFGITLPIVVILTHNMVIFGMVMYQLHQRGKRNLGSTARKETNKKKALKRLQNAFLLSTLMGLTWVLGFFAIADAKYAFSLLFCLCSSLQGFVLFILFCVCQDDVRDHLRPYLLKLCCVSPKPVSGSQATGMSAVPFSDSPTKSVSSNTHIGSSLPMSSMSQSITEEDEGLKVSVIDTANTSPVIDGACAVDDQNKIPSAGQSEGDTVQTRKTNTEQVDHTYFNPKIAVAQPPADVPEASMPHVAEIPIDNGGYDHEIPRDIATTNK